MKLFAYILMTVCLVLGTLSATTAYSPSLSLPDEKLIGLTLNDDAGMIEEPTADVDAKEVDEEAAPRAIAGKDDEITPALLSDLRDAGVERVRVKEFSLGRWEYAWLMGAACLGLIVAAFILKAQQRAEIAAELQAGSEGTESPEHALREIGTTIDSVLAQIATLPSDQAKMDLIIDQIGGLQWTHLQAIIDARTTLIGRLRLSGYAQFMDRFSAFERQLNRSWSAAADGVLHESEAALAYAVELLPEAAALLAPR